MSHLLLGIRGEKFAEKLLKEKGYKILARNFKTKLGEIDIVTSYKGTLIFVEVKTRTGTKFGLPEEAVDKRRILRIVKAGEVFMKKYSLHGTKIRVQVVSLIFNGATPYYVKIIDAL